ncbi:hypothetical protein C0995_015486 [Termitomyces sp. Mi166|nr:hypothetical protein C0995_015486 [Termitomyces sp. Mi166\
MAGTGNSTPQAGDAGVIPVPQAGEMPEASVYRPPHKREESDIQNVSASVGILPSLVYLDPSDLIGQQQSSVESLPQHQGGAYATPLHTERVRDYKSAMYPTQYQASIPEWSERGNVTASEVPQARYAPQENNRLKLTLSVQLKLVLNHFPAVTKELMQKRLQLYVLKHMQMLANMGQRVPEVDLTEYIKLYIQIFELELKEYMKCKKVRATARSTATPADSVDYDAIRHQQVPVIAEAMDALNALQQAEESQQDFERCQNAVHRQATISGVPLRAVSDIETTTSKVVDKEEFEILQLPQMPGQHITIKEEALECIVPADAENSQVIARRIPLVDSWNERVNYQRMRNQDLRL